MRPLQWPRKKLEKDRKLRFLTRYDASTMSVFLCQCLLFEGTRKWWTYYFTGWCRRGRKTGTQWKLKDVLERDILKIRVHTYFGLWCPQISMIQRMNLETVGTETTFRTGVVFQLWQPEKSKEPNRMHMQDKVHNWPTDWWFHKEESVAFFCIMEVV